MVATILDPIPTFKCFDCRIPAHLLSLTQGLLLIAIDSGHSHDAMQGFGNLSPFGRELPTMTTATIKIRASDNIDKIIK